MDDITKNNQGHRVGEMTAALLLPKKATQYAAKCVYIYIDLQTSADMLQNVAHCV